MNAMNAMTGSEVVVRAAALYLPVSAVVVLAWHRRPDRRQVAAAVLATAWNVPVLLAVNVIALSTGWWSFGVDQATVAGVPVDLWIGWAVLWGAVPLLATTRRLVLAGAVLVALDVVLMPLAAPVVRLGDGWLLGELVAVVVGLVPGLLLGRWTAHGERVTARAGLQLMAFTGLAGLSPPHRDLRGLRRDVADTARTLPQRSSWSPDFCWRRRRPWRCRQSASSPPPAAPRCRWIRLDGW